MPGRRSHSGPPRVAVVCEGDPSDPTEWSGTPYGLLTGLRECGVDAVPIRGELAGLPRMLARDAVAVAMTRPTSARPTDIMEALRTSRQSSPYTSVYGDVATACAAAGLRRRGPFDAVLQIGTSYAVQHPRLVTFEDMTVRQAVDHGQYQWAAVSETQLTRRLHRQGRSYMRSRAALTATPWAARSIVEDYGIEVSKVTAIGLGRNHEPAPSTASRDWSTPRFLFVGHDWTRKNGDALVAAFREVRTRHPQATLDLVGGHPAIDEAGVRGYGHLRLGDPDERRTSAYLFARATCLVVPSRFEAAGIVYLEAAAAGIPSIGTSRGGAVDMIGEGGLVVDPDDPGALVEAMRRMSEPALARRVGAVAEQRAADFTWSAVARRVLFHTGLGQTAPAPRW